MRNLFYIIAVYIVFGSCSNQVTRDELIKYIANPSNECMKSSSYNDLTLNAYYRPYDLLAYGEILSLKNKNNVAFDSIIQQYHSNIYFILSLKSGEQNFLQKYIADNVMYTKVVSYLSYGIKNDIQLIDNNNNKVSPTDCIFTRYYGVSDVNNVLLIFDKTEMKNAKSFTISLNSRLNDIGNHKFHFKTKYLEKIPSIDFKNIK